MLFATLLLGITITLPAEARVRGTGITLGSIAEVSGDENARSEDLAALSLGYAPAPGYARVLERAAIERLIWARFGAQRVEFVGAPATRVIPEVERIPAESLAAVARAALTRELDDSEAEIKLASAVTAIDIPSGDRPYELRADLTHGAARPGPVSVPVQVLVDGQPYRTVRTAWEVELWREVPTLLRDVGDGEVLTADAFELRRVQLGRGLRGDPLASSLVLGNVAARSLRRGDVLTARDVRRPSLIRRGDSVYLEVRKGAIIARIEAVAQEDGARGDRIAIVVASSQKEMSGTVVSRETVSIRLDR